MVRNGSSSSVIRGRGAFVLAQDSIWLDLDPPSVLPHPHGRRQLREARCSTRITGCYSALHHGTRKSESKNEGIAISAIMEQTQKRAGLLNQATGAAWLRARRGGDTTRVVPR